MEPITVSTAEARKVIGVGKTKIFQMLKDREIEAVEIGGKKLILVESLKSLIERNRQV